MSKDPYRYTAGVYDRIFDNMNKGLKLAGIKMFRPSRGMNILDVGCGTGSHLELYQRYKCNLYGLDQSPSMLGVAKERLRGTAQIDLGNAANMPYDENKFDLVLTMLSLHEMPSEVRVGVLNEIIRVTKNEGHILLIDFHPGPYKPVQGWMSKIIITISEILAGREHFRNYRKFMKAGGLTPLLASQNIQVEKESILAGGTFVVSLCSI